jgi:hypothetical protein
MIYRTFLALRNINTTPGLLATQAIIRRVWLPK